MIEFKDIHKSFGTKVVLNGVSLSVDTGRILYIVGTSGVGKSVLVKHLVGLLRPDTGRVFLDGRDITDLSEKEYYAVRRRCTMVLQSPTLFDSMTLLENVALPLRKIHRLPHTEALEQARSYLDKVQMGNYATFYPSEVGVGLQKRVSIARALTVDPEYVIFDEPTTGLDPLAATHVDQMIRSLSDDLGVTSIVVSHDLRSIFTVADRVAMLYKGKVQFEGTRTELRNTTDPIVRQFIEGRPEGPLEIRTL